MNDINKRPEWAQNSNVVNIMHELKKAREITLAQNLSDEAKKNIEADWDFVINFLFWVESYGNEEKHAREYAYKNLFEAVSFLAIVHYIEEKLFPDHTTGLTIDKNMNLDHLKKFLEDKLNQTITESHVASQHKPTMDLSLKNEQQHLEETLRPSPNPKDEPSKHYGEQSIPSIMTKIIQNLKLTNNELNYMYLQISAIQEKNFPLLQEYKEERERLLSGDFSSIEEQEETDDLSLEAPNKPIRPKPGFN